MVKELDKASRRGFMKMDKVIGHLRTAVSPVATLSLAHTFVTVLLNEGKSLTELAEIMGSSVPTASRNVLDLGDRNRKKEEGYKLVKSTPDPMNLRQNRYALTPKGRLLADQLLQIMIGDDDKED